MATTCNQCGDPIVYTVHVNAGVGRRIPVNVKPHAAGNVRLDWSGALPSAELVTGESREQAVARGEDLYMSHYHTCGGSDGVV